MPDPYWAALGESVTYVRTRDGGWSREPVTPTSSDTRLRGKDRIFLRLSSKLIFTPPRVGTAPFSLCNLLLGEGGGGDCRLVGGGRCSVTCYTHVLPIVTWMQKLFMKYEYENDKCIITGWVSGKIIQNIYYGSKVLILLLWGNHVLIKVNVIFPSVEHFSFFLEIVDLRLKIFLPLRLKSNITHLDVKTHWLVFLV